MITLLMNQQPFYLLQWKPHQDQRGSLIALDAQDSLPFTVARIYYLYGLSPKQPRGFHAHKQLQQVAVCLQGRCRFLLESGQQQQEIWLTSPDQGLYLGPGVWREMHDFSPDCLLLVMADRSYDPDDYLNSREAFKAWQAGEKLA